MSRPTHILDTSVFSQPLKRRPVQAALDRWARLGDARCVVSAISFAEVLYGLDWSGATTLRDKFEQALRPRLAVLVVDEAVAEAYGTIRGELRRQGRPVADMDLLIAATAQAHGLIVATLNVADFNPVHGLTVEDWSQA